MCLPQLPVDQGRHPMSLRMSIDLLPYILSKELLSLKRYLVVEDVDKKLFDLVRSLQGNSLSH